MPDSDPSPALATNPRLRDYFESLGANEGYGEELYRLFQANPAAVPQAWQDIFRSLANGRQARSLPTAPVSASAPPVAAAPPAAGVPPAAAVPPPALQADDKLEPLRGAPARIATNMQASLSVPTATSQRSIPVRLLEENRRLLNESLAGQGQKLAFTPFLAWAVVRATETMPSLNAAYTESPEGPARIVRGHINLGLAVDVERNGTRTLLVPVVKRAEEKTFAEFAAECERLIRAARTGKATPDELSGASLSLTNPGTIGTRASVPRLMYGQAAIVAAGAVAYPAGFEGVPESTLQALGIGKTVTLSCTYDHRIVQGAESGAFLARIHQLLLGEQGFYERIFREMGVPLTPLHWTPESPLTGAAADYEPIRKQAAIFQLVRTFRVRGHLLAPVDPLGLAPMNPHPELDPAHFGLTVWDLDRRFLSPLAGRGRWTDAASDHERTATLREILEDLRATYCGPLSAEFMHLQSTEERDWLQNRMEPTRNQWPLPVEVRRRVLEKLNQAEAFETLLHARFVGHKRFSLEGAEVMIPALDHLLTRAGEAGIREVKIGMSHRGRLNVLTNIVGTGMNEMFSKFEEIEPESVDGSGDVKYHIGARGTHAEGGGVALELIPNPSHLEAVDPVTEGAARASQNMAGDPDGERVLPLLIHGDAAFAGQGVVAETLNLSQLEGYYTGGTVHLIINNQIGFTTTPAGARSTLYCTDVARIVEAPIFHVNGDRPEAVLRAVELAFAFRQQFHKDAVIDLVCYRRHGHNEADDPSLTQPLMYRRIEQHTPVRRLYAAELASEGVLTVEQAEADFQAERERLSEQAAQPFVPEAAVAEPAVSAPSTAVDAERLQFIGEGLCRFPEGFALHPKLKTGIERRRQAVLTRGKVDWSLAEALAMGSLALEQVAVRLAGQDSGRGTFSQRHAVLHDYRTGEAYVPLAHLSPEQKPVEIYDSLLSEEAAMGFEFGYAITHPAALVLWEAQFGDFANGAQVVIDQFLASSYVKWGRACGLTLLLPHGYEGQGPEHSSARMERFLQLSAEDNWRVANCTTAAQYFHLLRSQGLDSPVRPLVVFTPKSLLRHPEVASPFAEFTSGGFQPVLGDTEAAPEATERVLLCSGKVYYDLKQARKARGDGKTAIIRVEQLYPLSGEAVQEQLTRYSSARQWRWVQEEPANMGAWTYMQPRLAALVGDRGLLEGVTRPESASTATGSLRRHQQEQASLLERAFAEE